MWWSAIAPLQSRRARSKVRSRRWGGGRWPARWMFRAWRRCSRWSGRPWTTGEGIDILANVAGITLKSPLEDLTEQDWDRVIDVNLKGTFLCSQAVGRVMIEQGGGSILNIGSVSGIAPHCNRGAYGPSKAAVDMLSKVMAVEWAERNIRVNTIHPGTTETEMTNYSYPTPELRARREKTIPLRRFVKPEEVAAAAVFLVSDDAGAITGHSLVIDGGFQHGLFQLMERLIS